MIALIDTSQNRGLTIARTCSVMMISYRRVMCWKRNVRLGLSLADEKPGPRHALHRLLPEEIERVKEMAGEETHADLSHRILAVSAWEKGLFHVSFSSVYRILKSSNLMSMRGPARAHNGRSKAPDRKELTGPNQRWCWDVSYLPTLVKGVYLYLYLLLDEFSRKAVQWRISWRQTAHEGGLLIEGALGDENILDLPESQRPEIVSDRGRQMKAKSIKRLCEIHQMPQMFARPRTPNDNPFVESFFSTTKTNPEYPGCFVDDEDATLYMDKYIDWYNYEHYHSAIDYVTPHQAHQGLREEIVERRNREKQIQRQKRRQSNQQIINHQLTKK
ncbi:MAG: DDE-type integrase/transposase/recombinase [Verrucomicrobia bacterium]|nr:DDE-type integrase/transposase/recombinase [Verrucomicrobiota bacterium]